MRAAYHLAEQSILTVPLNRVPWLPAAPEKASFIPVGSGIPELSDVVQVVDHVQRSSKVVAVFGVTGGQQMQSEASLIADIVGRVRCRTRDLQLVLIGRGSEEAKATISHRLNGKDVRLSVLGVVPGQEVAHALAEADALLFVRGHVSSRRSSAIAGIAAGLPVVGYSGSETGPPITEAGVVLVAQGDSDALTDALSRILTDEHWRYGLRQQAIRAWHEHFSWEAISRRFLEVLG
jgi:hypothetical protein